METIRKERGIEIMEDYYLLTEELVVVQVLDGIGDKKMRLDDEFFSDSYKGWLQIQRRKGNHKNLQLVESPLKKEENENQDIYEEANEEILLDLELYNNIYHMPMLSVTNQEWDLFFKNLYSYYLEKDLLEVYLPDMVTLNRMAIAKSLINNQKQITLMTYISALKYMESEVIEISDILEMIKGLEVTFGMENLEELVQNADGSYGNYGKEFTYDLEGMERLEAYFISENIKETANHSFSEEQLGENVISFQKYLSKRKN